MKAKELKNIITSGGLAKYSELYEDILAQEKRFILAIDKFCEIYTEARDIEIYSVPGRSEICGNHTDHNLGCVLAGAIDRDIIAVVSKNDSGIINLVSEGYPAEKILISEVGNPERFKDFSSAAIIAGVANAFLKDGYSVGGFDAYLTTEVLSGSGLSSSAAYEVMIGNIINHTYNSGGVDNKKLAEFAKYAENVYFGKPCGLMDQMACAVGGFVYIDFLKKPAFVEKIDFSLSEKGYSLCITDTRSSHANLNDDYAAIPGEMKAVAKEFSKEVLRGICEEDIISNIKSLRSLENDRAILRALHFIRENKRVNDLKGALLRNDMDGFLRIITASGASSFKYLQNVYTSKNTAEQGVSLALAVSEGYLDEEEVCRVHGGGFAGTVQAFVKTERCEGYQKLMDKVFGEGACATLKVRPLGACRLF